MALALPTHTTHSRTSVVVTVSLRSVFTLRGACDTPPPAFVQKFGKVFFFFSRWACHSLGRGLCFLFFLIIFVKFIVFVVGGRASADPV